MSGGFGSKASKFKIKTRLKFWTDHSCAGILIENGVSDRQAGILQKSISLDYKQVDQIGRIFAYMGKVFGNYKCSPILG
jgi:hypothetical protein